MGIFTRRENELKPYTQKERPKCPFYGFNGMYGMLIDSEGNQCALITESFSPCQMEMSGKTPNWSECLFNNKDNMEVIGNKQVLSRMKVFPKEFHPPDEKPWSGVSLDSWIKYITDDVPMKR